MHRRGCALSHEQRNTDEVAGLTGTITNEYIVKVKIPFLDWTARAALEIEISDDTEPKWHLKVALEVASKNGANLYCANLDGANLYGANLYGANLTRANLPPFSHCPEIGAFTAFKKLRDNAVATLEIPAEAKRTSALFGRKCRAEFVKVLAIVHNGENVDVGYSDRQRLEYRVGEIVRPDSYNGDIRIECTSGIHFFISRKEAEDYSL